MSDNPNNKFPNTEWVRIESNNYLMTAGENINALEPLGSNSQSVRIDWQHRHSITTGNTGNNLLTWNPVTKTRGDFLNTNIGVITHPPGGVSTTARTSGWQDATWEINNAGAMNATQTFDNRPRGVPVYIWRRIA